jgi:hypothetical protein
MSIPPVAPGGWDAWRDRCRAEKARRAIPVDGEGAMHPARLFELRTSGRCI